MSLEFCDLKGKGVQQWLFNRTAMTQIFRTPDAAYRLESKISFLRVEAAGVIVSGKSIFELQMPFPLESSNPITYYLFPSQT